MDFSQDELLRCPVCGPTACLDSGAHVQAEKSHVAGECPMPLSNSVQRKAILESPKCFHAGAQWQAAMDLFHAMPRMRLRADAITYSSVISALAKGKQWDTAVTVKPPPSLCAHSTWQAARRPCYETSTRVIYLLAFPRSIKPACLHSGV